jgi:surfeit locus 1 family protein
MRRKSFAGPTIFTILGVALLLGLGTWQVQRLHWKTQLIAERASGVAAAPVPLPSSAAEAASLEYHHVTVRGHFLPRTIYMHALSLDGAPGYHVIAPLALDRGTTVLIDRGFVPEDQKGVATPEGEVAVTGLLRLANGKPSWFTPDNDAARGEWFYVDLAAMAKAGRVAGVLPFYVDADRAPGGGYPIGGQTPLELPNHHLQYAITWYALAACLVIVYILLLFKKRRET